MLTLIMHSAIIVILFMCITFIIAHRKKDNSLVDIAWGIGFIVLAFFTLIQSDTYTLRQLITTALITFWGARLSLHIYMRHFKEDVRYQKWRNEWKRFFLLRSFFQIFMVQAVALIIIALPIIFINAAHEAHADVYTLIGTAIWIFGFVFEVIGDYQLQQFIASKPAPGSIMDKGLWRYTRHPNYFGEAVMWWGIFIIACGVPSGILTIISPILITYLLTCVSGVPMTEALFDGNAAYDAYKKRTSAFIPLPVFKTDAQ